MITELAKDIVDRIHVRQLADGQVQIQIGEGTRWRALRREAAQAATPQQVPVEPIPVPRPEDDIVIPDGRDTNDLTNPAS